MHRRWILVDALVVEIFVVIGRSNHHHGMALAGVASTSWPFLVALALGWLVIVRAHRDAASLESGVLVWLVTVSVGMVLRVVAGQGTAVAFIVVALVFLGALMLGLRAIAPSVATWRRGGGR